MGDEHDFPWSEQGRNCTPWSEQGRSYFYFLIRAFVTSPLVPVQFWVGSFKFGTVLLSVVVVGFNNILLS